MTPKRLAVIGCGAVVQRNYLPALKQVPDCTVDWFVDTNLLNASKAAQRYGGGEATTDYTRALGNVDAAIVAVPNYLHSKVSVDFLNAGIGVLCEKPLADNKKDALEIIRASHNSGAPLAVNFVRRRFESYRATKELLKHFSIGEVRSIDYREGHSAFSWPFSSSYLLDKKRSGGGVLIDWGVHELDMLNWLFGFDWKLVSYKDDGNGRIESNCEIDFNINWNRVHVPCHLELSYMRDLGTRMVVRGDSASLDVDEEKNEVHIGIEDKKDFSVNVGRAKSLPSYFADQIRAFVSGTSDDCLAGEDALNSLLFIEECYENRQNLAYPWNAFSYTRQITSLLSQEKKILVVGASGFLGTRLVERLVDLQFNVRAGFHTPAKATRLARLPVELVELDLLDRDQVMRTVKGSAVIINCAVAKASNSEGRRIATEVYNRGTKNLLDAAREVGVDRVIHISSAAVMGFSHRSDTIDESSSIKPKVARNFYEKGKISQENILTEYANSLPIVILRPTLIYGPFSFEWAIGIVERLRQGKATLIEDGGIANLVYVDDVVDAILLAIEKEEANGTTLIINNDEEIIPWKDYVSRFANLTKTSPVVESAHHINALRFKKLVSLCMDSIKACSEDLRSREMMILLARIPLVVLVGSKLMGDVKKKEIGGRLHSGGDVSISDLRTRLAKYETMPSGLRELLTCRTVFSSAKARATLGWAPHTSFEEGIRKTLLWADWTGLGRLDSSI
ncbi:MAG: NAD-dependent epimerase/dehydratase family protein [Candidatus Bathyarchaeia archaeon]